MRRYTRNVQVYSLRIDPNVWHQRIRSFGTSGCWWSQHMDDPDTRGEVARLLFCRRSGAGISLYRHAVGAGAGEGIGDPWRRGRGIACSDGRVEPEADPHALAMFESALAHGVPETVVFFNSPPAWLTSSGVPYGTRYRRSNLAPKRYRAFVAVILGTLAALTRRTGVAPTWVSPVNEPDVPWRRRNQQEGCSYTPRGAARLLALLAEALSDGGFTTRVVGPEAGNWRAARRYLSAAGAGVAAFAAHSYFSTDDDRRRFAERYRAVADAPPVWMSEWTEMKSGRDYGMDSALTLARTIIGDLTLVGVESWQTWIAVSKYDYHDGLIYWDPAADRLEPTKRLWALGNFARFVRPGAMRIAAEVAAQPPHLPLARRRADMAAPPGAEGECAPDVSSDSPRVVAFADEERIVVVLVNATDATRTVLFEDLPTRAPAFESFVTAPTADLSSRFVAAATGAGRPGDDGRTVVLEPRSVTTLVVPASSYNR
ncbi:MAG: hypothetical protein MI724_12270 [Spirochaetales bacterium]|nr:hypothetical protein [Spirochaetales bacterium]